MERERFQFLKSYADVIQNVAQADKGLAGELCLKIINYGIYGIDEKSDNPMIEALFIQIKIMIDKGQEITDKNKENGKKGGRPKNPNKTQTKPNDNPDITKIENRKYKKENNIDIISKDITETKVSEYGNPDINKLIDLVKEFNGGILDGTVKNNRRYGKLLIDKLNKLEKVQNGEFTWYDTLTILLKVISDNKYYASKITSVESIYRNLSILIQQCKADLGKQQTMVLPVL